MRTHHHLAAILTGTAVISAIVVTLPSAARALSSTQVNDIAREVTVLISGEQGQGSGVIIQRNGNTYSVLTAYHVVSSREGFQLLTADKQPYKIDASKIRRVAGVDLAVVEFTSDKSYSVAKIGTSKTNEGQDVFASGWISNGIQPDPRDKIDNLQATLKTLSDIKKTADGVRNVADSIQKGINSIRGLFGR